MTNMRIITAVSGALLLSACATDGFQTTWKSPDTEPMSLQGQKVAAIVMIKSELSRRAAEDTLAKEISARGAQGVPMYTIFPEATPDNEAAARAAIEKAGIQGAVVMRPVNIDKKVSVKQVSSMSPVYGVFWSGYYGYGWGMTHATVPLGSDMQVDTVAYVETLVYSLKQNKLVWSGQSKTTNPENVNAIVRELSAATAKELQQSGLTKR